MYNVRIEYLDEQHDHLRTYIHRVHFRDMKRKIREWSDDNVECKIIKIYYQNEFNENILEYILPKKYIERYA
jgi:hypothetical protein